MPNRTAALVTAFEKAFAAKPEGAVRAPGRVNLIGEHTDYNHGFCLPMAIERDIRICWRRRGDRNVRVTSLEQTGTVEFPLTTPIPHAKDKPSRWADYVKGCAQVLQDAGIELVGVDLAVTGDVPLGSGLCSSAALEVASMLALISGSNAEGSVVQHLPSDRIAYLQKPFASSQLVATAYELLSGVKTVDGHLCP